MGFNKKTSLSVMTKSTNCTEKISYNDFQIISSHLFHLISQIVELVIHRLRNIIQLYISRYEIDLNGDVKKQFRT